MEDNVEDDVDVVGACAGKERHQLAVAGEKGVVCLLKLGFNITNHRFDALQELLPVSLWVGTEEESHTDVPDPYPGVSTKQRFRSMICSSNPLLLFLLSTFVSSISLYQCGYGLVLANTSVIPRVGSAASPCLRPKLELCLDTVRIKLTGLLATGSTCTISSHVCTILLIRLVFPMPVPRQPYPISPLSAPS